MFNLYLVHHAYLSASLNGMSRVCHGILVMRNPWEGDGYLQQVWAVNEILFPISIMQLFAPQGKQKSKKYSVTKIRKN